MALESFYGGKQGVSPVIKGTFKFISTTDPWYQDRINGSENTTVITAWEARVLNSNKILNNGELWKAGENNIWDNITWTAERLAPFTMDECFKSSSYKKVWYNELCIIDTSDVWEPNKEPTGSTHGINNPNNGRIYRRTLRKVTPGDIDYESSYAEYIGRIIGPQGVRGLRGYMGWRGFRGLTLESIEHIDSINHQYSSTYPIYDTQDIIEYNLNNDTYSFKENASSHQCNDALASSNYYSWLIGKWTFYNLSADWAERIPDPETQPIEDTARSEGLIATTFYTKICDLSFSAIQTTVIDELGQLLVLYTQIGDRPLDDTSPNTTTYYQELTYNNQEWVKGTDTHPIIIQENGNSSENIIDTEHWWLNLGVVRNYDGLKVSTKYTSKNTTILEEILLEMNTNPKYSINIQDGLDHRGQLVAIQGYASDNDPEERVWVLYWDYVAQVWTVLQEMDFHEGGSSTASRHRVYIDTLLDEDDYKTMITLETDNLGNSIIDDNTIASQIRIWA